jgi:hypothetical protein
LVAVAAVAAVVEAAVAAVVEAAVEAVEVVMELQNYKIK